MAASGSEGMRRVGAALGLQAGEGRRVVWMGCYSAAAIGGVLTVGLAAAGSLYLSQLPPSDTPWMFISSAISGVATFAAYSVAAARVPRGRLVLVSNALLLALALILRILLATPAGASFSVLLAVFLFVD